MRDIQQIRYTIFMKSITQSKEDANAEGLQNELEDEGIM